MNSSENAKIRIFCQCTRHTDVLQRRCSVQFLVIVYSRGGSRRLFLKSQVYALSDFWHWLQEWVQAVSPVKLRHWWSEQQGTHTPRPISMVRHIKLPFTDKRRSGLLVVTPVLQQALAEWEMAPLCSNHLSTKLITVLYYRYTDSSILINGT